MSITACPLSPNPFGLHLRSFRFVVVQRSQCALTSSVHSSLSSRARPLTQSFATTRLCITFPLGSTALSASNSLRACRAIPALCCVGCHLPDLFRHKEFVPVPWRGRSCSDLRSCTHQPIMWKDRSFFLFSLTWSGFAMVTSGTQHKFLELSLLCF